MRVIIFVLVLLIGQSASAKDKIQKEIYVKDKDAAVLVAEAFLTVIYGKQVLEQRPFKVDSAPDSWVVEGTLHCPGKNLCAGGVAVIEFRKSDGAILRVFHGK